MLRKQMKAIEDTFDYEKVKEVRQKGVSKLRSKETKERELEELQARTNAKIATEIGYGLMMNSIDKKKINARIQNEHDKEKKEIDEKYVKRTYKLTGAAHFFNKFIDDNAKEVEQPEVIEEESITQTEVDDPNKLPDDYTLIDIALQIPALNFTMDNEFGEKLLEFKLVNFNIFFK